MGDASASGDSVTGMAPSGGRRRVRPGSLTGWRPATLTQARRRAGLSKTDLAHHLGVSPATVWTLENGQTPSLTVLPALCAGLGVDLQTLADVTVVRAARLAVGLSVPELARRTGMSVTAMRHLDSGSFPAVDTTMRLITEARQPVTCDLDCVLRVLEAEHQRLALPRFMTEAE